MTTQDRERRRLIASVVQKEFHRNKPWYSSWIGAKMRCINPKHPRYYRYGGRGIKFNLSQDDARALWDRDSAVDMIHPSIDRINNDGDYVLGNCRFIERSENSRLGAQGFRLTRLKRYWVNKLNIILNMAVHRLAIESIRATCRNQS